MKTVSTIIFAACVALLMSGCSGQKMMEPMDSGMNSMEKPMDGMNDMKTPADTKDSMMKPMMNDMNGDTMKTMQ